MGVFLMKAVQMLVSHIPGKEPSVFKLTAGDITFPRPIMMLHVSVSGASSVEAMPPKRAVQEPTLVWSPTVVSLNCITMFLFVSWLFEECFELFVDPGRGSAYSQRIQICPRSPFEALI